ncbi:ribbon-helix-helix domain-containing protein [Candidatus Woesearchaeota archaeon]|nr:ribbon-helix-helix domain-containing protein [Candidatus Woesearchaeota archaeon]
MVTEMITLKLDNKFLKDIDIVVSKEGYQSRTEFIRNALREKLEDAKLKKALRDIARLRGAAKKKTTDKEYERIRLKAFEDISKKLK